MAGGVDGLVNDALCDRPPAPSSTVTWIAQVCADPVRFAGAVHVGVAVVPLANEPLPPSAPAQVADPGVGRACG